MGKPLSVLMAAVLAVGFALPLNAAPIHTPKTEQIRADIVQTVHDDRQHWRRKHYRNWRAERPWKRRHAYRSCRYYGDCYPRRHYGRYYSDRDYYPRYYRPRSGFSIYLDF